MSIIFGVGHHAHSAWKGVKSSAQKEFFDPWNVQEVLECSLGVWAANLGGIKQGPTTHLKQVIDDNVIN